MQLNSAFEARWDVVPLNKKAPLITAGWYVIEFSVENVIDHTPRLVIDTGDDGQCDRVLEGFHVGNNRMLIYCPQGRWVAHSDSMNVTRLARIRAWEARARIALICARYLRDFPRPSVILTMLGLLFQSSIEVSNTLLQFYQVKSGYLSHLEGYRWWHAWAPLIRWWYRSLQITVVVEQPDQKGGLQRLLFPPDRIMLREDWLDERQTDSGPREYVFYLAQTERLRDVSLLLFKRALRRQRRQKGSWPDMVYCDHDYQIDPASQGTPLQPVFKPEPSACYLYCYDYVQFALGFRRDWLAQQPIDVLFDAQARYRACLALFDRSERVLHVADVLIQSLREREEPTPAPHQSESPWKGIDWVRRDTYNALVAGKVADPAPTVDLIIPTRDGLSVLKPCVDGILARTDYEAYHIYIVDNGSEEPETHRYFDTITADPRVDVINYPGEFNYSAINNFAVSQGQSEYVGLINNDIEVIEGDWLRQMMAWACQPNVGIVGAKLLFSNDLVQHAGVTVGMGNAAGHIHRLEPRASLGYQHRCVATQNMMAVTAACLITPRSVFEASGGLDESVFKVAYNDIDYCLKVERSGRQVIWTPEALLYHHESVSRGDDMSEQHIARYIKELRAFQKRWKTKGFVDKYYNRHLRITDEGVYPQVAGYQADRLVRLD